MLNNHPIDFTKVDSLRRHMLLTMSDMATVFGVSRVTYHGWLNGNSIRPTNAERVKTRVRELLKIMQEHSWPTPEVISMKKQSERFAALQQLLD